ncbi:MAG: hypothetical protein QOJ83_176 [Frankiales bacterium]|nr:hypothetical protein [Frankiales bacterium]
MDLGMDLAVIAAERSAATSVPTGTLDNRQSHLSLAWRSLVAEMPEPPETTARLAG